MTDNDKKRIFKELQQLGMLSTQRENRVVQESIELNESQYAADELGTTSDGTHYVKKLVQQYLVEKGYPFTPENVELAAKMMYSDGKMVQTHTEVIEHHELEDANDEEIRHFMDLALLKEVAALRKTLLQNQLMEYAVRIVYDRVGGTDESELSHVLNFMSERGWRLKTAVTNELGNNSTAVSTSVGTFGSNTTSDQLILIFERPRLMNGDKGASDLIRALSQE